MQIEPEESIRALYSEGIEAVVDNKNIIMLRPKESEDELRKQRDYLAKLVKELETVNEMQNVILDQQAKKILEYQTTLRMLSSIQDKSIREKERELITEVQTNVLPHIDVLRKFPLTHEQHCCLDIPFSNLLELGSFYMNERSPLSPREKQIASLTKAGKTSKEIAAMLHLAPASISYHKNNIRRKLGLNGQKKDLRSHFINPGTPY